MKNIAISEGRTAKTFYGVNKIHTPDTEGGSVTWIPEDEADDYAHLGAKTITENGTYSAAVDSLAGYSSVTVNVPTGAGGEGESVFLDSIETSVIDYICTPNLVQSGDDIGWRDGATHSFSCTNTSALRGLWVLSGTNLVFKEQHLVPVSNSSALTAMHVTECTINGRQLYFTEIIDGTNPYGNYTFNPPDETDPEIAEMYKVFIRKTQTEYTKAEFVAIQDSGNNTYNFEINLGTGIGTSSNGRGKIKKDSDGLLASYTGRVDGVEKGVYIDDDNINIKVGDKLIPAFAAHVVAELPADYRQNEFYVVTG